MQNGEQCHEIFFASDEVLDPKEFMSLLVAGLDLDPSNPEAGGIVLTKTEDGGICAAINPDLAMEFQVRSLASLLLQITEITMVCVKTAPVGRLTATLSERTMRHKPNRPR
jgi:hypothetical protein